MKIHQDNKSGDHVQPLYTAPQTVEQKPIKSSLALDAAKHLTSWLEMELCDCEGGHTCGYTEVRRTRDALLAVAEQPDITQLVEALERLVGDVERATHVEFGGTLWLKEKMAEIDYARAALATHRKQEPSPAS